MKKKTLSPDEIQKLEDSRNAALKRVAKRLKEQSMTDSASAKHSSHVSGAGRTHTSYVTS